MSTLREHLEAIRDRWVQPSGSDHWNHRDAEAAIAILDASIKHEEWIDVPGLGEIRHDTRMVPDP